MKRYLIILLIPFLFMSCGETEKELEQKRIIDSLMLVSGQDEQTISEYWKSIREIQANLDEIKDKEKIITTRTGGDSEISETDVAGISEDISAIYELMQENKKKLTFLKKKMRKSNSKVSDLNKMVDRLAIEIEEKSSAIDNLKQMLAQKDIHLEALDKKIQDIEENLGELKVENTEKDETIGDQDKALHTAFYVVGTKKFLKENGIVTKEGGFIGVGGVQKIHKKSDEFTEIDIRNLTEISITGFKKAMLLTNHPASSYELIKDADGKLYDKLLIKDYKEFWNMSKYLVLVVK